MSDKRTALEKRLWEAVGPPLYYCAYCMKSVKVKAVAGREPEITRPCGDDCGQQIIAPRRAVATGDGTLSPRDRLRMGVATLAASFTGRCV